MSRWSFWFGGWAVTKSFPEHKGRPGQRGGSAPKGVGGASQIAQEFVNLMDRQALPKGVKSPGFGEWKLDTAKGKNKSTRMRHVKVYTHSTYGEVSRIRDLGMTVGRRRLAGSASVRYSYKDIGFSKEWRGNTATDKADRYLKEYFGIEKG